MAIWGNELGSMKFSECVGKNYPCEWRENVRERRFTGPHFRNLSNKWGECISFTPLPSLFWGNGALYLWNRKLSGVT